MLLVSRSRKGGEERGGEGNVGWAARLLAAGRGDSQILWCWSPSPLYPELPLCSVPSRIISVSSISHQDGTRRDLVRNVGLSFNFVLNWGCDLEDSTSSPCGFVFSFEEKSIVSWSFLCLTLDSMKRLCWLLLCFLGLGSVLGAVGTLLVRSGDVSHPKPCTVLGTVATRTQPLCSLARGSDGWELPWDRNLPSLTEQ